MREETSGELITFFIVSYFIAIASFSTLIQNNNDLFLDKKIRNNKKKLSLQQSIINESVHKASGHGKNLEGIHVQNNTTDIEHSKTQKI